MITEIAYQLAKQIATDLSFADKWAGLVFPLKKLVENIEKTFPASMNIDGVCDDSDMIDLVPNSDKKSILYLEKIGNIEFTQISKGYYLADANLLLVCWYNLDKINSGVYLDEGVIATNVLTCIPRTIDNALLTYSKSVNINPVNMTSGAELLSKYTYAEAKTQYATFPYGVIGIQLNIQYVQNKCLDLTQPHDKC